MKPSAEYRSAGGRAWNRVKSGNRGIVFDGPDTADKLAKNQDRMDMDDKVIKGKNDYKQGQADYKAGLSRQSVNPEYQMGYSREEFMAK